MGYVSGPFGHFGIYGDLDVVSRGLVDVASGDVDDAFYCASVAAVALDVFAEGVELVGAVHGV